MDKTIANVGNVAAVLGLLSFVVSVIARLLGAYVLGTAPDSGFGIEVGTLFEFGVGLMVVACLAKIQLLGSK